MQFPSMNQHFIRILFTSTALAVLSLCTVAQAQSVSLGIGSGGGVIELEQGTQGEIPISLFNDPSAPFALFVNEVDLFVEADLLMTSEVGFDITDSAFGEFGTTIVPSVIEDLIVEFRAPVTLGSVNLGTLVLDTSGLTPGDEVTLSFAGSTAGNRAFGNPLPITNLLNPVSDVTVTIVSSVPEPSACCLLTALSAIGFSRRRRR